MRRLRGGVVLAGRVDAVRMELGGHGVLHVGW